MIWKANPGDCCFYKRITDIYWAGYLDGYLIPDARVAVTDGAYPVPPGRKLLCDRSGNHAIASLSAVVLSHRIGGINDHCQVVASGVIQERSDSVFLSQEHARVGVVVDPFPIQVNIGSVVYAAQLQPGFLFLFQGWQFELVSKPVCVKCSAHIVDVGNFLVVHPVKHVGDQLIVQQGCLYRSWNYGIQPAHTRIIGRRNQASIFRQF